MKNTCKRLFSLMLAVVLLVSLVPMTALADETVSITVKDTNEKVLYEGTDDVGYTMNSYFRNFADHANYTPVKYWIKNADTGSNGRTVDADHEVKRGSTVVIKVEHNNVAIDVEVYNKDTKTSTWDTFEVPFNSTFTLNEKLLSKVGYNLSDIVTYGFEGYNKGETVTATGRMSIKINITTTLRDDDTDADIDIEDDEDKKDEANNSGVIKFLVKVDGKVKQDVVEVKPSNGKSAPVKDLLYYHFSKSWDNSYDFSHYWIDGEGSTTHKNINDSVKAGQTVHVALTTEDNSSNGGNNGDSNAKYHAINVKLVDNDGDVLKIKTYEVKNGDEIAINKTMMEEMGYDRDEYDFDGLKTFVVTTSKTVTVTVTAKKNIKYQYDVYLNIYTNGKIDEPAKHIKISNGAAVDGKVSLSEVKSIVKEYYTAKDSDGIEYDGLYMAEGNWLGKFIFDDAKSSFDVSAVRNQHDASINVMIRNVKARSTGNSSDNPKTGDEIFMTVTVMAVSATALACVYFFNKKRMAK